MNNYTKSENIAKIAAFEESVIIRHSGESANTCRCADCQNMCRKVPCLGTPLDILKLCEAGYADRLSMTTWMVGYTLGAVVNGKSIEPIEMMQATRRPDGSCNFFDRETGLCELHEKGLKPIEGRLASCQIGPQEKPTLPLTIMVALTWQSSYNIPIWAKIAAFLMDAK